MQFDMQSVWRAWAAGELSDATAQAAADAAHAANRAGRALVGHVDERGAGRPYIAAGFKTVASAFQLRRPQRSPDRARSIERRRTLAASGPMPPQLAACFTTGELAALRIVADEARQHGGCRLHVDAIAARAGVCRTTAQNGIRAARRLALLHVEERRRRGLPSLTNIIRIISDEWNLWLDHRPRRDRVQKIEHHGQQKHSKDEVRGKLSRNGKSSHSQNSNISGKIGLDAPASGKSSKRRFGVEATAKMMT